MKRCYKCGKTKLKTEFNKNKTKWDGVTSECRACVKEYLKIWRSLNIEKTAVLSKEWYDQNKQRKQKFMRDYCKNNLDKFSAHNAKRRAAKLNRMLKWGKELLKPEIDNWYKRAKLASIFMEQEYHVDHIVPLQGKNVSGLHVPWNLQLLTKSENLSKGNRHVC